MTLTLQVTLMNQISFMLTALTLNNSYVNHRCCSTCRIQPNRSVMVYCGWFFFCERYFAMWETLGFVMFYQLVSRCWNLVGGGRWLKTLTAAVEVMSSFWKKNAMQKWSGRARIPVLSYPTPSLVSATIILTLYFSNDVSFLYSK